MTLNLQAYWPKEWGDLLREADFNDGLNEISHLLESEREAFTPSVDKVFAAFKFCGPEQVKVLIVGQDPYPTPGHANGLAFSADRLVRPIPKSLQNIFKELENEYDENLSLRSPDLTSWAQQGVLLLNTQLTTREGIADAHKHFPWTKIIQPVLEKISQNEVLAVLLWGKKAEVYKSYFQSEKHLVLTAPHPSPLSAYRGFFGCNHFRLTNEYLIREGKSSISWLED